MWAAINKKSRWQEDLNSLIQLWNDLKFIHKSHTNTQKPFSRGRPRDTDPEVEMKNKKLKHIFAKVSHRVKFKFTALPFFCLLLSFAYSHRVSAFSVAPLKRESLVDDSLTTLPA